MLLLQVFWGFPHNLGHGRSVHGRNPWLWAHACVTPLTTGEQLKKVPVARSRGGVAPMCVCTCKFGKFEKAVGPNALWALKKSEKIDL